MRSFRVQDEHGFPAALAGGAFPPNTATTIVIGSMPALNWPALDLPIQPPLPPMEARLVHALPQGSGWSFEPKWDGFRCLAFKDRRTVVLQSKAGRPLTRYFPEIVHAVAGLHAGRCVLDGELVIPVEGGFSFEPLLLRMHPSESRVRAMAHERPAALLVFDLLVDDDAQPLVASPYEERRAALERFAQRHLGAARIGLSPATRDFTEAERWLSGGLRGIDGVVAKRLGAAYAAGDRAMQKVKLLRTADCVVGGIRWAATRSPRTRNRAVGSLLLGLYGGDGLLHCVGHAASFDTETRHALTTLFLPLVNGAGFSGTGPDHRNRWARDRSSAWIPVRPSKVIEVEYHHASDGRFRHGTRFLRTRPDKSPRSCTLDQLRPRPARTTQGRHTPAP